MLRRIVARPPDVHEGSSGLVIKRAPAIDRQREMREGRGRCSPCCSPASRSIRSSSPGLCPTIIARAASSDTPCRTASKSSGFAEIQARLGDNLPVVAGGLRHGVRGGARAYGVGGDDAGPGRGRARVTTRPVHPATRAGSRAAPNRRANCRPSLIWRGKVPAAASFPADYPPPPSILGKTTALCWGFP